MQQGKRTENFLKWLCRKFCFDSRNLQHIMSATFHFIQSCSWMIVTDHTTINAHMLTDVFSLNKCTSHRDSLSFIYFFYLFLSVLDYCNLVNSHLKSSHWPDALKSMIFIFTITIIGPIETGKPNPKKKHLYGFLNFIVFDVFFHSNYKKEKKYI